MDKERVKRLKENEMTLYVISEMIGFYGYHDDFAFCQYWEWREFLEEHVKGMGVVADIIGLLEESLGLDLSDCKREVSLREIELEEELDYVEEKEKREWGK